MEYIKLYNGVLIPILGFGTARIKGDDCFKAVCNALSVGYRHIDTAHMYENENEIGRAILASKIKREELFITSKLYHETNSYDMASKRIDEMLKELNTSYVDLLLLHEPFEGDLEVYRAIEDAYTSGKARAIGISNFDIDYLKEFLLKIRIKPMVDQVECHPYFMQLELKEFLDKNDIKMTSYAPLTQGQVDIFNEKDLIEISKKHNVSIPQIILSYIKHFGIIIIPKTIHKERMMENLDIFDINLTDEEIKTIKKLDRYRSLYE